MLKKTLLTIVCVILIFIFSILITLKKVAENEYIFRIPFFNSGLETNERNKVIASSYPDCNLSQSTNIHFSLANHQDKLEITIKGSPCWKATLEMKIKNKNGDLLYKYSAKFKKHTAVPWDSPDLDQIAENFILKQFWRVYPISEFHSYKEFRETYDYFEFHPKTSSRDFELLRKKKLMVFEHLTHYEGWRFLISDKTKQNEVIRIEAGL